MIAVDPGLPDRLQGELGDALRSVATYENESYEFRYLRPDVEARYSTPEIEEILDDLVLQGLSTAYLESLFHAGSLETAIYGFEQATMFHFIVREGAGLFVSVDRDTDLNLESVVRTCREAVAEPASSGSST